MMTFTGRLQWLSKETALAIMDTHSERVKSAHRDYDIAPVGKPWYIDVLGVTKDEMVHICYIIECNN